MIKADINSGCKLAHEIVLEVDLDELGNKLNLNYRLWRTYNLKGENIPLGARILRICDVFGALVAHRPYRDAFTVDKAIRLMIKEIKNYDMACFLALQRIVNSESFGKLSKIIEENKKSSKNIYQKTSVNLDLW